MCSIFQKKQCDLSRKAFPKLNVNNILDFPIDDIKLDVKPIQTLLDISNDLEVLRISFLKYLRQTVIISKISRKLEYWYELSFGDFIKELNKAIKATNKERSNEKLDPIPELTKKDEFEWMELFEENKRRARELQTQIASTEKEIDQMVYELYGLTEEEIAIVENS